jgi:hypothetical protein
MWIKSLLELRLYLQILFLCALLRFVATAQDIQISLPLSPLSPKQMQECDQLQSQWDSLHQQVATAHQKCLDVHSTEPVTPNSGSGPGSICNHSECQSLHNTLFSEIEPQTQTSVKQCRDEVNQYQQQQAATQAAVQLAQQQLQQQVNYFRNRGQQLADQAMPGQQAASQQRRDMQASQQSAHQQMEAQLKATAQNSVDQLEAQKTSPANGSATDTSAPTTNSSSSATVPSDAVTQQVSDGSAVQAQDPNPQPNVASDPAPATHSSPDMTVEQYQANGLSPEDAQKAVEYNSASGTASRAMDDLTGQLTQLAPSDSSQPVLRASSSSDPPMTGHDATADDLRFAADMKAVPLLVKPVLDSWNTIPTLVTYMEGGAPAVIWDTIQDAGKDKVKELLFDAISQELCSNPTNQTACATNMPTPQPGPVPSKSNQ